jgi:hypothetical protein
MRGQTAIAIGCLVGVGFAATPAVRGDSHPTFYVLDEGSTFDYGCYGPCKCPIFTRPLRGRFELKHAGVDPLYDNYEVTNVKWQVVGRDARVDIGGSGKYRVGGEFAIQHQLSLNLKVGDHPEQHFDSGLIPGGGEFPKIDISISVRGKMACFDTVIHVIAVPVVADVDGGTPRISLERVRPNPFRSSLDLDFTLRAAGPVELRIYDPQGRAMRVLERRWLEAGPHSLPWDGRRDDGTECAAGLYFALLRSQGTAERRAMVKLE